MSGRFDLGWRQSARLRYGKNWRKAAPTLHDPDAAKTYTIRLILVGLMILWATDRDTRAAQAEIDAFALQLCKVEVAIAEARLLDCMNGRARWITESQREAVVCDKAWILKL